MKHTTKALKGLILRTLLIAPIFIGLWYTGQYSSEIQNITIITNIFLMCNSLLFMIIVTFIPPQYAVKTEISVIEYMLSKPAIASVNVSVLMCTTLALLTGAQELYGSSVLLVIYSIALYMWPKWVKRVDGASKEQMFAELTGKSSR